MVFNTIYNIINYIYMEISFISLIILVLVMVFIVTFNNISAISWRSVLLVDRVPGEK
jgi:hypothetical protein